ncbi:hypothetical protein ABBQ32_006186 [Trebouxia sp. C0010 RCD-2024]
MKVVTNTVQEAATERQQKAEVNAFHEQMLALVKAEPDMLECAVKSALTGDPVTLYGAIHAHQKTQIQALDKRLQEEQDQAAAAASQLVTERQSAQQLQQDNEQALLEQRKKTQAAVARAEEQTALCNTLQQSLQEAVVNNQKLLGVHQLSESRDAALGDAVQRETAAARKSEQDARRVSRMAMSQLQEVAAANSQAQLLVDELALQKQALEQLQDDLRAGQKNHEHQLTCMRDSNFPAAQAESIAALQREQTVAKTDATEAAKEAAKESAAAAAQGEDNLKELSGQRREALERADKLQAEVTKLRNTGGGHCSNAAVATSQTEKDEADSAGVSESEQEVRGRAAFPQGSAKATAGSTHVGECEWCHEGSHELKNCPLVNLLQEDAVAPKEPKEQAWQMVQPATPKPPRQQASQGRQQGKGKKRGKHGGKGQALAGGAATSSGNPSSRHPHSTGGSAPLQTPHRTPADHTLLGPRTPASPSSSSHDPKQLAAQHTPHNQGKASALPPGDGPPAPSPLIQAKQFGVSSLPIKYRCLEMASAAAMLCCNESKVWQLVWRQLSVNWLCGTGSNAWSRLKGPAATTAPGPSTASNEPGAS